MVKNEKIVQTVVRPGQQPTDEQIKEIEAAMARQIVPDEDAPELTPEQYAEMAAIARERRNKQVKPVVALRIFQSTLEKAKATGKGSPASSAASWTMQSTIRRWSRRECDSFQDAS